MNSISGIKTLSKSYQQKINGGSRPVASCAIGGCCVFYIGGPGNACVIPSVSGEACFGIVENGICCV